MLGSTREHFEEVYAFLSAQELKAILYGGADASFAAVWIVSLEVEAALMLRTTY